MAHHLIATIYNERIKSSQQAHETATGSKTEIGATTSFGCIITTTLHGISNILPCVVEGIRKVLLEFS
jgi:hypothetical protein